MSTTTAKPIPEAVLAPVWPAPSTPASPVRALGDNFLRLLEMLTEEVYDDDFLPPSSPAVLRLAHLLTDAAVVAVSALPPADLGSVGDGGLIAQWGPDAAPYVRLLVPADPAKAYIFTRARGVKKISPATADDLARELAWLGQQG